MIAHLEHEVAQFLGALAEFTAVDGRGVLDLDPADPVRIRRTAFFEIVLLHARLLDDFLGTEPTKRDDFWARHFIDDWEATSPLDGLPPPSPGGLTVRQCINKQLARDQTVYGPPLNTRCSALDGPATVRISNQRDKRQSIGPHHSTLRWRPDCCGYFRCHMPPRRPPPWPPSRNGILP
jgi:hypothetical protein